jgi:hypothetical protein
MFSARVFCYRESRGEVVDRIDRKGNRSVKAPTPPGRGRSVQPRRRRVAGSSRGGGPRRKTRRRDRLILIAIIIIAGLLILRRTVRLAHLGRVTLSRATATRVAPPSEQRSPLVGRSSG